MYMLKNILLKYIFKKSVTVFIVRLTVREFAWPTCSYWWGCWINQKSMWNKTWNICYFLQSMGEIDMFSTALNLQRIQLNIEIEGN